MYGPKWPFLLMYGSHDMRHTGFPQVDRLSTDSRDLGRQNQAFRKDFEPTIFYNFRRTRFYQPTLGKFTRNVLRQR